MSALWVDITGTSIDSRQERLLRHENTLGVILFARNYIDEMQIKELAFSIKSINKNILLAVDHEGGRIIRFPHLTQLPSASSIGKLFDKDPELAKRMAYLIGATSAVDLINMHVDLSFAPVLDINRNNSEVLKGRTWHENYDVVIQLTKEYIAGMNDFGMKAVGKHFPGHGGCSADSHLEIATDNRNLEQFHEDIEPYMQLHNKMHAIMLAHIIVPKVDSLPISLSTKWMRDIYRERLKLNNLTISDCLSMKGISSFGTYLENANNCLKAGTDTVILTHVGVDELERVLDGVMVERNNGFQDKINNLYADKNINTKVNLSITDDVLN